MSGIKTPIRRRSWAGRRTAAAVAALVTAAGIMTQAPAAAEPSSCIIRSVSIGNASSAESILGAALRFTVTSSGTCAGSVTYTATTAQVEPRAGAADFVATTGQLSWPRDDVSPREIVVPLVNDLEVEQNEVLTVQLSQPVGLSLRTGLGIGTIVNDDQVEFELADSEPECWQQTGTIDLICDQLVHATRRVAFPVTVYFSTTNGSAIGGQDFYPVVNSAIAFAPGAVAGRARVLVRGDRPQVAGKYLYVTLSAPTTGTIKVAQRSMTIPLL